MENLLYVFVFMATVMVVEAIASFARGQRDDRAIARARLERLSRALRNPAVAAASETSILRDSERSSLDALIASLPNAESLQLLLYRAGSGQTPRRFIVTSLTAGLGGFAVGSMLVPPPLSYLGLGLGILPFLQVHRAARSRMASFERQLPDALELLVRALRAGHSLSFGFQMVGEELPDPIGTEFSHLAEEMKFGQEATVALSNLAHRINVEDLPFFVTAVTIQRETGGNLTEILEKLAYVIRERFRLYGKIRGITAMGRMSANLLVCWPFVMVGALMTVNRDYVAPLWETPQGHTMVTVSAVLVTIGYVICRRMAELKA